MPDRPNILWIHCDELRTDALGCYGHRSVPMKTPHIDALAERGVLFENCFCNSPVCVPSRTSMLTARYPSQTGVYGNEGTWGGFELPVDVTTFPQVFSEHGYATGNFGKSHVNQALLHWDTHDPTGGSMGELFQVLPRTDPSNIVPDGVRTFLGGQWPKGEAYPHDIVAENAMNWIEKTEQPFFARLSLLEPHTPVYPPPPFDTLYDPAVFSGDQSDRPNVSEFEKRFAAIVDASNFTPDMVRQARAWYYGLVGWVDEQVGRMVEYLRAAGKLENTIIVFDADHGASLGEGGCWAKHLFAPQSQRVPRVICYPKVLPAGERRPEVTENLDLARTLLGLCKIDSPGSFMGRDLFADPPAEAVYASIGFGQRESRAFPNARAGAYDEARGWPRRACVRTDRFRLDRNILFNGQPASPQEQDVFLADVQADPDETENLAGHSDYRDVQDQLMAMLDAHLENAVQADVEPAYAMRRK